MNIRVIHERVIRRVIAKFLVWLGVFLIIFNIEVAGSFMSVDESDAAADEKTGKSIRIYDLPKKLGFIQDQWMPDKAGGSGKTVFIIQDAHCNYFAQKKVSEIIQYFFGEYAINVINLEGSSGKHSIKDFSNIYNNDLREKVADYLMSQGVICGADYSLINNPGKIEVWGVEDINAYQENLAVYRDCMKYESEINKYLSFLEEHLGLLKDRMFPEELKELYDVFDSYRNNKTGFKAFLIYLLDKAGQSKVSIDGLKELSVLEEVMSIEKSINFSEANKEKDRLIEALEKKISRDNSRELKGKIEQLGKYDLTKEEFYEYLLDLSKYAGMELMEYPELVKFSEYIHRYDSIAKRKVLLEMDVLIDKLKNKLFKDKEQRELAGLLSNFELLKKYYSFTLSSSEYREYMKDRDNFRVSVFIDFINKYEGINKPEGINFLDTYQDKIRAFYEYSFVRDEWFLKNIKFDLADTVSTGDQGKSAGAEETDSLAILITGGFHAENLSRLFKEKGIGYVLILPDFWTPEDYQNPYFKLLSDSPNGILDFMPLKGSSLALYSYLSETSNKIYTPDQRRAWEISIKVVTDFYNDLQESSVISGKTRMLFSFDSNKGKAVKDFVVRGKQVFVKVEALDEMDEGVIEVYQKDTSTGRNVDVNSIITSPLFTEITGIDLSTGKGLILDIGVGALPFTTSEMADQVRSVNGDIVVIGTELPGSAPTAHITSEVLLNAFKEKISGALSIEGIGSEEIIDLRLVVGRDNSIIEALVGINMKNGKTAYKTLAVAAHVEYSGKRTDVALGESEKRTLLLNEMVDFIGNDKIDRMIQNGTDDMTEGVKIQFDPVSKALMEKGAFFAATSNPSKDGITEADIITVNNVTMHFDAERDKDFKNMIFQSLREKGILIIKNRTGSFNKIEIYQREAGELKLLGNVYSKLNGTLVAGEGFFGEKLEERLKWMTEFMARYSPEQLKDIRETAGEKITNILAKGIEITNEEFAEMIEREAESALVEAPEIIREETVPEGVVYSEDADKITVNAGQKPLNLSKKEAETKEFLLEAIKSSISASIQSIQDDNEVIINIPGIPELDNLSLEMNRDINKLAFLMRRAADRKVRSFNIGKIRINIFEDSEEGRLELLEQTGKTITKWNGVRRKKGLTELSMKQVRKRVVTFSFSDKKTATVDDRNNLDAIEERSFVTYLQQDSQDKDCISITPFSGCVAAGISILNLFDLENPQRTIKPTADSIEKARRRTARAIIFLSGVTDKAMIDALDNLIKEKGLANLSGLIYVKIRPVNFKEIKAYMEADLAVLISL